MTQTTTAPALVDTTTSTATAATTTLAPRTTTSLTPNCPRSDGAVQQIFSELPTVGFTFHEAISDADRQQVFGGVLQASTYLAANLGGLAGTACVETRLDGERAGSGTAGISNFVLFFHTAGWRPPQGSYPAWHLAKVSAHEFSHIWQHGFRNFGSSPIWLSEGIAEYIGYHAVIEGGVVSASTLRAFSVSDATARSRPPLSTYEQPVPPSQAGLSYGMAELAVEYLLDGREAGALRSYHVGLQTRPWQESFSEAFGVSAAEFYDAFEAYRNRGFR